MSVQCPICLLGVGDEPVVCWPCMHIMHLQCAANTPVSQRARCPQCRRPGGDEFQQHLAELLDQNSVAPSNSPPRSWLSSAASSADPPPTPQDVLVMCCGDEVMRYGSHKPDGAGPWVSAYTCYTCSAEVPADARLLDGSVSRLSWLVQQYGGPPCPSHESYRGVVVDARTGQRMATCFRSLSSMESPQVWGCHSCRAAALPGAVVTESVELGVDANSVVELGSEE